MPSDTAWAAPSSWLRSAGCINARHHRGCACGLRVSGTRNDQTSVGACEREASVHLETWASPGESPAHRSSEWCHKPVWSGAPHVCATIVAACMCACPRHYRGAMGPLDVYEPFGGGYSRCGGPCGCDMSVSVLAVAYVIIHLPPSPPPHPQPLRHTPHSQPTSRPVDPRACFSVRPHPCSAPMSVFRCPGVRSPSACHPTPAATPIPAVAPACAERRDHQRPPLGGPVSRLLPCQVCAVHPCGIEDR
jgi:hypothetical protein